MVPHIPTPGFTREAELLCPVFQLARRLEQHIDHAVVTEPFDLT